MGLEPAELARWTRFAAKGGIGRCIATCDCVAESADDLMFLKDDEITVLLQLPDREGFYLGYCEGVVGRFSGEDVRFLGKLKKPVMTKRVSSSSSTPQSGSHSPSWQSQTHRQSPSASPGGSLNANRSTDSPSDSIHMSPFPSVAAQSSPMSPLSSAYTSQPSTYDPLSPPPKTRTSLTTSSITISSSSTPVHPSSVPSPAVGGRSVSGPTGASASASSSIQPTGRPRTGSLDRTGSPSSGGHAYGQGQRYLASPLGASTVLTEDDDGDRKTGSSSRAGSGWHPEDGASHGNNNNFATLHERTLAQVDRSDGHRFLASETPLTASPRDASFNARAGEFSLEPPPRENSPLSRVSSPPSRINSPPSRVHSPPSYTTSPPTHTRTASPAVQQQSRTSSPAINQLHHSGTSSPAYHNSRTASPSIHQQYNPSPVSTPPPNSQPSLVSSPASASFVSAQNSASTLEGSPAPTIESTLTALTSPPMTSRNLPGQSQPRYTALAPAALTLSPTSQSQPLISPLRINKRSPGPGPTGAFNGVMPAQRSPPPTGALPVVPGSPPASGRDWAQGQSQDNYGQTLILPHSPFAQHFAPPHSARSFGTAPSSASVYSAPSMYSEASSPVGRDPSPGQGPPEKQALTSVPSSLGPSPPSLSLAPSPYPDPAALQSLAPSPLSPASSSPSHTTTFAHRLGLASPASDPFEDREGWREGSGGTVGSSPATLGEAGVAEVGDNHTVELNVQNMHADADVEWKMNGDGEKGKEADHAQAQRAGVSIGLSLLEGLIGTYSDSEDESGSEYGDSNNNTTKRAKYLTQGANVANRVSVSESEDETVEGLGYARSEDDHTHVAASLVPSPPPPPPQPIQQHETMRDQTPERHLSPTTSPTSPGFPEHSSPHGYASSLRHPRAADARSARSVRSDTLSSWEGDIYDNYRYSRAEGSVRSGISGTGGTESVRSFGVVPFTHTERRPSFDSVRSGGVGPWRERVDSGAGRKLDGLVESGGEEEESASGSAGGGRGSGSGGDQSSATTDANSVSTPPTDTETPGRRISKRHQHTRSADSDASVYTQNSRLSTLSRDLAMGGVLAGLGSGPGDGPDEGRHSPTEEDNGQGRRSSQGHKPSPLNLQKSVEPLLSTSWGSPVSSPTESSASLAVYTPFAGVMDNQGRGGWAPGQDMLKSAHAGVDDAPRSPNTMAGFATAMRMRLEEDRAQQAESDVLEDSDGHGLGRRIVVEDDEELPSRIMNSTFDSQAETETSLDHHSADHSNVSHTTSTTVSQGGILGRINSSPSPEPQIQTHLASLVVANRSPTPGEENDSPLRDTQPPLPSNTSFSPPDPAPPATLAPPSTANDAPPAPSHLRPSLAELRAPGGAPLPGTNQRRSLFLPHPGAPKAPEGLVSPGPRYIAAQGHGPFGPAAAMGQSMQLGPGPMHPGQLPGQPARANVFTAIRMALAMSGRPPSAGPALGPGPGLRQPPKGPTIYGRIDGDLASSSGPVPITFGIEAPKATAPPPGQVRTASTGPQGQAHPHAHGKSPLSGSAAQVKTKGPQAGAPATAPPRVQMMSKGGGAIRSVSLGPGASSGPSRLNPSASIPMPGAAGNEQDKVRTEGEKTLGAPIPRANFFPKAAGMRPRSRSFSGFNSGTATEVPLPKRSREDAEISSLKDVQRARSPTSPLLRSTSKNISPSISPSSSLSGSIIGSSSSATTTPASSPSSANIGTLIFSPAQKPGQVSVPSRPSPLSLSHVHSSTPSLKPSISSPTLKPPSSPLAQSVISTDTERPETGNNTSNDGATNVDAKSLQRRSTTLDERASLAQGLRSKTVRSTTLDTPPSVTASGRTISLLSTPHRGLSQELKSTHSMLDLHTASRTSTSDSNDSRPQVNLPPPSIGRQNSLRSKLSLPNLRRKQSRADDDYLTSPTSPTAPNMPGSHAGFSLPGSLMHDPEMLQVKDIEFELVRPNLAHHFSQAARTSEDSNVLGRDASLDIRQDASSFLRADSPAMSISSSMQQGAEGSLTQQTLGSTSSSSPGPMAPIPPPPPASAGESSVEAHRARELKWMSLMSSSPASQARKSKKVRRLLVEGVPSSVRYLVWTYLTDGKARFVKGVYSQLSSRGRVSAAGRIEEDVRVGFVGQGEEHLQGTKGGVLSLLSAYLNMVPDVQYSMGLSLIVGQLLLLAPEEDGFWIFVSIMDTHVRPYFSPSTTQMDVDASLFSRALENNDAQLAKKLFVDMSILPSALCAPWFSSLFVGSLPPEHLNRVWDLFLFEGIPFLLRVGVALLQCCRRVILEMTSDATVLRILRHPPISLLPPSPDAFLALVFAVKLKDDDVRKQRVKMEAQVKRQTQAPRTASTSGVGMISLPRT